MNALYVGKDQTTCYKKNTITKGENMSEVQYITDDLNNITGVIVPIDLWHELQSEKETAYLLKSDAMKERLLAAKKRDGGTSLEETCEKLGV